MAHAALRAKAEAEAPSHASESDFSPRKVRVALVCLLGTTFATSLLPFMAMGYVLKPMTQAFGWSRAEFQLANSSLMWAGAMTIWALGWMTDRIGARPVILIGTFVTGLITLAIPHVQNQWQFYALFALLGVFGSSGASYSKVLTALFTQNRGKAMAIFGAEGALVRMLIPAITSLLILHYAWQGMFTVFGLTILVITPVLFLGLDEPGTRGFSPTLGFTRRPAPRQQAVAIPFEGMSVREVMRDWVFWLMLGGSLAAMVVGSGMLANIVPALEDRGFSQQAIAEAQSIATFVGIPGVLIAGVMMDKLDTAKIAAPFQLLIALSAFLLMIVTPEVGGTPLMIAASCLFGLAFASALPMTFYFLTRFFGLKSYATVYGIQSAIQAVCMGFAPPLFGHIYDVTHSYRIGFEAHIAASLLAAAVFLVLPAYRFSADIGAMPAARRPQQRPGQGSAAVLAAE